jgi:hypothetical protein
MEYKEIGMANEAFAKLTAGKRGNRIQYLLKGVEKLDNAFKTAALTAEARAEAKAKRIAIGRVKGEAKVIKALYSSGMDIDKIAEMFDLDREYVVNLQQSS